jgi:hypothetical protein
MGSVFSLRNLIYWWMLLTSAVFLQGPARNLAQIFRDGRIFSVDNFPFNLATGLTQWITSWSIQIVRTFQFNPEAVVVKVGQTTILNGFRIGVLLSLILLGLAVRYYMKAAKSPRIYDDIIALIICFFVYHLEAQTFVAINLQLGNVRVGTLMAEQRAAWVGFLGVVIFGLIISARGFYDSRVFWKGMTELFVVWLFLMPNQAASSFGTLLATFADVGGYLTRPANLPIATAWAFVGLLAALYRLYTAQPAPPPKPAGGGGGGGAPRPAASSGGLLTRLRGH